MDQGSDVVPADASSSRKSDMLQRIDSRSDDRQKRLQRRRVWRIAFSTLVVMMRNVVCGTLVAWLATYCFSRGNVFASTPVEHQSRATFVAASMMWCFTLVCPLHVVNQSSRLLPHRFARFPDWRPSFAYCFWRLSRATLLAFVLAGAATLVMAAACTHVPLRWRRFKLEFYLGTTIFHLFYTVTDLAARRIYQQETVEGQQKAQGRVAVRAHSHLWRLVVVFIQSVPSLLSIFAAGAYVHMISQSEFSRGMQMLVFVVVSMALKLMIQEIAKHYVMQNNVRHLRSMCIVVGIPTVLINTQVRIVILSMRDEQFTMLGTWLMAALEVVLRLGKVLLLRWQVRRKRAALHASGTSLVSTLEPSAFKAVRSRTLTVAACAPKATAIATTSPTATAMPTQFGTWRTQMFALHTAEIYADMYAEYIAIGCSSAIYFFFSGHAQYKLGVVQAATSTSATSTTSTSAREQFLLLAYQVAIELVVDYVSCVVELLHGVDFSHVGGFGVFLGFLFTTCALLNIDMTSVLYIATT